MRVMFPLDQSTCLLKEQSPPVVHGEPAHLPGEPECLNIIKQYNLKKSSGS